MDIRIAESEPDIAACYDTMSALRPHIAREDFVARARAQMAEGYRLARADEAGVAVAVAGFRILSNLAWGRFLYVDDLVTRPDQRSRGHGATLLAWLADHARRAGCAQLHLDSGIQRKDAHRFYQREGMPITSYHFARMLDGAIG